MKRFIIILSYLLLTSPAFSHSGWIQQQSGITESLRGLYFINANTGWVAGDSGRILRTTNGGTNWVLQNSNTRKPLSKIVFTDENNGRAEGNYPVYGIPFCYEGVISLATTNGGIIWIVIRETISVTYFTDLNKTKNAYYASLAGIEQQNCMASIGGILRTTNNGLNWTELTTIKDSNYRYNTINFINDQEGWAIGEFYNDVSTMWRQKIIKSTNGGIDWQIIYYDAPDFNSMWYLRFLNSTTGYLLKGFYTNDWGSLSKTTDGGRNWFQTDSTIAISLRSFHFINPDTGWCIGWGGKIIRTNNGGLNWMYQNSTVTNYLSSVQFITPDTGYIVGDGGLILKTGNGGLTSISQNSFSVPASFTLEQNYPNPFNPTTIIRYGLPESRFVSLKIYDVLGKEVLTLANEKQNAGIYELEFNAENFLSGVYFYKIEAGDFIDVKRMLLIK